MKRVLKFLFITSLVLLSMSFINVYAQDTNTTATESQTDELNKGFLVDYDPDATVTCEDMLGAPAVAAVLNTAYTALKIGIVIYVIVVTMLDFTRAVAASDPSMFKKTTSKFVTRLIVLAAILLVPTMLNLIISIVFGEGYFCTI